ncbi:hypothetical protein AN958_09449 [Leucoagaricus sp. SymC.cos]|nr:hypothetical protein AN958_09449 [Leucoagaricus sp. SymC.cos]
MENVIHQSAYRREPKIADPQASRQVLQRVLEVEVPNIKVHDLLALDGGLRK